MTAGPMYIEHESPARQSERNVVCLVDLSPFGQPGFFEQIVLVPNGSGNFVVQCIPFRAYGFSLGDEVAVNAEVMVESVVKRNGNRTLRTLLAPSVDDSEAERFRVELDRRMSGLGLLFEWNGWGNVVINVPASTSAPEIASVIEFISGYVDRQLAFCEWSETVPFEAPMSGWPGAALPEN